MDAEDKYTKDGTVDRHGNPANKKKTGREKTIPFILGNECCERLAYYGMGTNLVVYLKTRLNQGNTTAANNVTNWSGTCYILPLLGAFFADAYLGRYLTIASFSIIYVIGMTLLTLSASVPGLKPSCENGVCHPTQTSIGVFFLALYLIALGTGGIKPCVSSFGADQFDETDEMHVGWGWGFGIPAVAKAVAVLFFFSGTPLYRHQKPGGSPLTRLGQVVIAASRKSHVKVPDDKTLLYENEDEESAIKGSRKLDLTNEMNCCG